MKGKKHLGCFLLKSSDKATMKLKWTCPPAPIPQNLEHIKKIYIYPYFQNHTSSQTKITYPKKSAYKAPPVFKKKHC